MAISKTFIEDINLSLCDASLSSSWQSLGYPVFIYHNGQNAGSSWSGTCTSDLSKSLADNYVITENIELGDTNFMDYETEYKLQVNLIPRLYITAYKEPTSWSAHFTQMASWSKNYNTYNIAIDTQEEGRAFACTNRYSYSSDNKHFEVPFLIPAYYDTNEYLCSNLYGKDCSIVNYASNTGSPAYTDISTFYWRNDKDINTISISSSSSTYYYDVAPPDTSAYSLNIDSSINKFLVPKTESNTTKLKYKCSYYFLIGSFINTAPSSADIKKSDGINNYYWLYNQVNIIGCFRLDLIITLPKYNFPTIDSNYFKITGVDGYDIPGDEATEQDISIWCTSTGYIKQATDDSIGVQFTYLDMSARLTDGTSVVVTSKSNAGTSSPIHRPIDISTVSSGWNIGEYDASYNNTGARRSWSSEADNGGIIVKARQYYSDSSWGARYDTTSYNLSYALYQAAAGVTLRANTNKSTVDGSKQTLSNQFTLTYNIPWYICCISTKFKFNGASSESIYAIYLKYENNTVSIDSSVWSGNTSISARLMQYVEEYTEYLFNNMSTKYVSSTPTSVETKSIDINTYGHTLNTDNDSNLNISFIFHSISDEYNSVASYEQEKTEFAYYKDADFTEPIDTEYTIDPFKYVEGRFNNFYFKSGGAAYKTYLTYGNSTSENATIKYNSSTVFSDTTSNIYNKSTGTDLPIVFTFPAAKLTTADASYVLNSYTTGIDNVSTRNNYLEDSNTSIQLKGITTITQDNAILEVTYDGAGSSESLSCDEQYPRIKIIASNNWFINKYSATTYQSLNDGSWGGNQIYVSGASRTDVTYDNSIFYINSDSGASNKDLLLHANPDPSTARTSKLKVWSGNSVAGVGTGNPENSQTLSLTQGVAEKTYTYIVKGSDTDGNYVELINGTTAKDFKQDGSETYYLAIINNSNQSGTYSITCNDSNLKINGKVSESITLASGYWESGIKITVGANDSNINRNYSLLIDNNHTNFNFYFTQQGGERGVSIEGDTIIAPNTETPGIITVKNTGTITANYRITGEDNFVLFGESAATTTGNISAGSSTSISYKILANNTDEKRTGYITAEDVNDAFLTNTRKGVIQSGHNKPIFYLQCVDKDNVSTSYPSSSEIKGEKYLKFTINPSTSSLTIDPSTKIEIITTSGCSVQGTTTFPANYIDASVFYVKFDNNATNEKVERYITVNAYFDGVELTSETYTKSTPYSVAYQLYAAPNAEVVIAGYDSGEYKKDGYYIFGPGIGTREITVYDQNSGPCSWSTTNGYNLNNYSINYIPASSTSTTKMVISTNNINSATSISDSSYKITASNTLTGHSSTTSEDIKLKRYPQPTFNAVLYKGKTSYNQSISLKASDFSKNKESIDISILITPGTNVNYSYEIVEYNTTGNEFVLTPKAASEPWILTIPRNISKTLNKKCIIRFTYNYDNTIPNHDVDKYVTLTITSEKIGDQQIGIKKYDESLAFPTDSSYLYNYKATEGSTGIILDISTSSNYQQVTWDYATSEVGTEGNEFIISKYVDTGVSGLKIIVPNNTSYYNEKICYLNISYYYVGCTDETQYNTVTYTFTVGTAPRPTLKLYKDSAHTTEYSSENVYDSSCEISIYLDTSNGLPIIYNYETFESGTTGNEFIVKNTSSDRIDVEIPYNTSVFNSKTCLLTFNYYYEESSDKTQFESKTIKLTVNKAKDLNLVVLDASGETFDSSNYDYFDNSKKEFGLKFTDSSGEVPALPYMWEYSTKELGTSGNEFIIDTIDNSIYVTLPVNTSISSTKICLITFKYYYQGIQDETQYKTKSIKLVVDKADKPTLSLIDVSTGEEAEDCTFNFYDGSKGFKKELKIVASSRAGNNLPIVVEYATSESGTTGNEFYTSKLDNSIYINIPTNTSTIAVKSYNLNLKYYYQNTTSESEYYNKSLNYTVGKADELKLRLCSDSSLENEFGDSSTFAFNFGGDVSIYLDTSANKLPVSYEYSVVESGTEGSEFLVTKSDSSLYIVSIPSNTSLSNVKTGTIIFKYYYKGVSDTTQYNTKAVKFIVEKATEATLKLYKDSSCKNEYASTNSYNYYDSSVLPIYVKSSDGLPVIYEYSTVESGTEGNEFILAKTGNDQFALSIPTNLSYNNAKTCYITFTYYYDKTKEESGKKTIIYKFIVNPANVPSIHIVDSSDNEYTDRTYACNFGKYEGSLGILMYVSPDSSNHLPIVYSYESVESGTTGNEFIISKEAYSGTAENTDQFRVIIPTNTSTTIQKKCQITFKYYYEGTKEETQYQTRVIRFTVNTIGKPNLKLVDDSSTEFNDVNPYNCDYAIKDGSNGINIHIIDSSNDLPVVYDYSISETGTTGTEFIISKKDTKKLNLQVPINVSLTTKKICNLTVKYYYEGVTDTTQYETIVISFIINIASKPTIVLNPSSYNWPGTGVTGSIDISAVITCDNSLDITWIYESEETGTTGNEFSITKYDTGTNKYLHLVAPANKSLDTNKVCKITATCYYAEAKEHINDSFSIGTYTVGYVSGPKISFDSSEHIIESSLGCSEDASNYSVKVYRLHDDTSLYTDATKVVLNKTELTYNSIKFGEITSGSTILFENGDTSLNIDIHIEDNIYEYELYDYIYITGYDDDGHEGKDICKLKITQAASKNYCPNINTAKVSVTVTSDKSYYNLGFSHYNTSSGLSEDKDFYIKESSVGNQFEILDYGFVIKESDSNTWTNIWNSKYKNELIFTSDSSTTYVLYSGSLPYTNSVFKYSANKKYDYAAIAKVNYRKGKSEEWLENQIIYGTINHFKLGEYRETDLEYIRPYFKPVEKVDGYLTGVEIKNFINSKGVVFNRKKAKTIDIVNWYNDYTLNNNKLVLNVNDALIDLVLHSEAFNKSWNYLGSSLKLIDAKKLYIKNNILPNIIINSSCKLDIYYDKNSTTTGILSEYNSDLIKVENITHTLKYSATSNSYTLNLNLPENKQYCIILHLQY